MRRWGLSWTRRLTTFCRRTSVRRSESCSLSGLVALSRRKRALSRLAIVVRRGRRDEVGGRSREATRLAGWLEGCSTDAER